MTKLPEKNLLNGSKIPKTTTGEMKTALGKLRDYLSELFGDDSSDKEKARQTLGIDLSVLTDKSDIETALSVKADKAELAGKADKEKLETLEAEIAKRGIPVGAIDYFATANPPPGYLKADGSAVGRQTYPELFAAIGTVFGEGDGVMTFNLPDLIDRFAQGNRTPGLKIEAGLPNITGRLDRSSSSNFQSAFEYMTPEEHLASVSGAFSSSEAITGFTGIADAVSNYYQLKNLRFDASDANPVYGASNTVQPPALTLLPCIRAFDASTNTGMIDITELAGEMAGKLDKTLDGTSVKYIAETFSDGTNWWRQWSDGWLEQGGTSQNTAYGSWLTFSLLKPFSNKNYTLLGSFHDAVTTGTFEVNIMAVSENQFKWAYTHRASGNGTAPYTCRWYACGMSPSP